ncbi:MAG: hypothetical protein KGV57_05170 [Fusobacterium sp.]|nr:hypothetical protein [Fusobacterium sp.]
MINRDKSNIDITTCIPFLAKMTPNKDFYYKNKESIKEHLFLIINKYIQEKKYNLILNKIFINNRDNENVVYMVPFGSALDTGDYGVVGRGNKYNGVISIVRESNIEAFSGKNPIYH